VPILRPFRALRFDLTRTDLSSVLCPPYDIISPAQRLELLDRDPHNAVRIELPADLGTAGPDDYRAAARTVAQWRTDGVLRKDRSPALTIHRMTWIPRGGERDGQQVRATGVLARLRLEPFAPDGGVLPHERTLGGPKEDRYALLRATGLNTSPIVLLGDGASPAGSLGEPAASIEAAIGALTAGQPDATGRVGGVSHEVWIVPTEDRGRDGSGERTDDGLARIDGSDPGADLLATLAATPLTIADGHHRYETALRYREERGRNRACESDPAWDYVLALVYPAGVSPPALPTHRVMLDGPVGEDLVAALGDLVAVERLAGPEALLRRMSEAPPIAPYASGSGRIGKISGPVAAILEVRPGAVLARLDPALGDACRGLDVNAVSVLLEALWGGDAGSLASAGRLRYVKDAVEAVGQVTGGDAATTFLLDPIPASVVTRVARAGDLMPQKSTYFDPKAPTGLLFSPMEW
jgi:uncharacterized protein (DUF1015 family)